MRETLPDPWLARDPLARSAAGCAGLLSLVLLVACATSHAPGTEPIAADRPGEATPPSVVGAGIAQIEGGVTWTRRTRGGDPDTNEIVTPGVELRLGVLESAELQVLVDGWVYEQREDAPNRSNGSDAAFGVKARFTDADGWKPSVGTRLLISVPTGGRAITSDGVDPDLALLAQWDLSARTQLLVNAGFGIPSRGADTSGRLFEFRPQIALQHMLSDRVAGYVEYAAILASAGEPDEHGIDGGFAWIPFDDFQVDVSAGAGLDTTAPDFFVAIGGAWRFALPR